MLPHSQFRRRSTRQSTTSNSRSSTSRPTAKKGQQSAIRSRKQTVDEIEQAATNGSSPFKWRRKVAFPSSDEIVIGQRPIWTKASQQKNTSQSAPVSPAATNSKRSSTFRSLSKAPNIAHSSPVLTSHTPAATPGRAFPAQQSFPETWIGTQAMLYQAQRDLITSPEKPGETPGGIGNAAPAEKDSQHDHQSHRSDREPLKQLSQEPMPSTQAMIGDFVGFSTVKKPWKSGPRESIDSPSVLLRTKATAPKDTRNGSLGTPHEMPSYGKDRRSSSVRFSPGSVESPLHSTVVEKASFTAAPILQRGSDWSSPDVATSAKKSSSKTALAKTSPFETEDVGFEAEPVAGEDEFQSLSSSTSVPLPSFQAAQGAQGWSSLPHDDSDIDQTFEELTTYLLDQTDMAGVLSQLG